MKTSPCQFNEIVGKIKVLSMEVRTSLSMEELAEQLKGFFGKGALGLVLKEDCPDRMTFEGGGGHVTAAFCAEAEKTLLKIVASGWAIQVKRFVDDLP